jgi:hypothetical protein
LPAGKKSRRIQGFFIHDSSPTKMRLGVIVSSVLCDGAILDRWGLI